MTGPTHLERFSRAEMWEGHGTHSKDKQTVKELKVDKKVKLPLDAAT
jgi:hypothetical protein